jgi:hypothetical protein
MDKRRAMRNQRRKATHVSRFWLERRGQLVVVHIGCGGIGNFRGLGSFGRFVLVAPQEKDEVKGDSRKVQKDVESADDK